MLAPFDRRSEWFVPNFGPEKFRLIVGLLFLPYTGMVISYALIGSMLAPEIHWDRVVAIAAIYFLALGIGAHALDAIGSRGVKPWGEHLRRATLWAAAIGSIVPAYALGIYYMVLDTPLLWVVAILEGFFLFAYNLEWFSGRFHTDGWFVFSWGVLPVLAGFILQTNRISIASVVVAAAMGLLSYVEISASRPYKELKRRGGLTEALRYEGILKGVSLGVILLAIGMILFKISL